MQALHHGAEVIANAKIAERVVVIVEEAGDPRSEAEFFRVMIETFPECNFGFFAGKCVEAIAAAGGGAAFRSAVASGIAPCVSLSDPDREWLVVNKQRPLDPIVGGAYSLYVASVYSGDTPIQNVTCR